MPLLIEKAKEFVMATLQEKLTPANLYHNYNHTQRVVKHIKELIEAEGIGPEDAEILELAAWFHDVGHIEGPLGHEAVSAEIAENFLKAEGAPENYIEQVKACILATKMGVTPVTDLEKLMVDADFSHFASKNYDEIASLLREELELTGLKTYTDEEWLEENIQMFNSHHRFYTSHAIENWQPEKNRNLVKLMKALKKIRGKNKSFQLKSEGFKLKKDKLQTPERGIETMYRVSLRNHIDLSSIADTKANILLSVNAIIISLALSNLIPKLDNPTNYYLILPTMVFVIFSVASMIMSVLATRPNVTGGEFTKDDVAQKKVNLLFFGNFHKMKLDDFEWGMNQMMNDREYLYGTLTKDLYFLGKVLDRKYRLLRITYNVFMTGIILSVLAFALAFKYSTR